MTSEQAIKWIKQIQKVGYQDNLLNHKEALDMAIKALEQQPCDDAISRQAAIDAIVAGEPYDMEYNLKMIRQLPSVSTEKTGRWIPPKNATNGEVLCMLFPNMHYTLSDESPRVITTIGCVSSFDVDWWNAPYKSRK